MRKTKQPVSPSPSVFYRTPTLSPEALEREATSKNQKDFSENTIIWGEDNQFPLKLAQTVHDSPAASACISTICKYIRGARFSDAELMKIKINKTGQTLWDLHVLLSDSLGMFEGFSANLKFNEAGDITNAYSMAIENSRFVKPEDDLATNITHIKYNPYFGTSLYQKKYTKEYPIWEPEAVLKQAQKQGKSYPGQVYYYCKTKPLYRFYSRPQYWSAKGWMYIDSKIQEGHSENMDNGFFQSVIINMVGDPNKKSTNPAYMKKNVDANGVVTYTSDKTVGEEFADMMKTNFSGTKKQGSAMVFWSVNKDSVAQVEAFPSSANADIFETLQDLTTKNITIATGVPGILANISEGVNLGSGGSEIQKAVEIMQSNTSEDRTRLEQFYNEVLLPRLAIDGVKTKKGSKVEIVNYNPITVPIEIDDKFWNELDKDERRAFIRSNISGIELKEPEEPAKDADGNPIPESEISPILKNLTMLQLARVQGIVKRYNKGLITEDQAKQLLMKGYGFTESDVKIWLIDDAEEDAMEPQTTLKAV